MQQVGQLLVVVGIGVTVFGVVVAGVQAVIQEIKKRELSAAAAVPSWPEKIGEILLELVKKGGGLAIAAVGLILIYIGLQLMNRGTEERLESSAPSSLVERPGVAT